MSEVKFSKLDDDFAYIKEDTTLVQRHILCLTSYFPDGMRYNNKELGKFFQLSPERISRLVSNLKEKKFIIIHFEQSKYRAIFLNENHSTLAKMAKYHESLHCCREQSKTCLHCLFGRSTLMKRANSIKGSKGITTKEGKKQPDDKKPFSETSTKPQENSTFDKFWKEYPKKVAKQDALKAWKKISPDQKLFDEIMSALEIHKQQDSWIKENGKYVLNPTTWLNQERWTDEIAEPEYGTRAVSEAEAEQLMQEVRNDN